MAVLSGHFACCPQATAAVDCALLPPSWVNAVTCFLGHLIIIPWSDSLSWGNKMESNCHLRAPLPMLSILLISWALNWRCKLKHDPKAKQTKWLCLVRTVRWQQPQPLSVLSHSYGLPAFQKCELLFGFVLHSLRKEGDTEGLAVRRVGPFTCRLPISSQAFPIPDQKGFAIF